MGDIRNAYKIWLEKLKIRDLLEDLGVDGRVMYYNRSLGNGIGGCGLDLSG
jgi:hypothetical protein